MLLAGLLLVLGQTVVRALVVVPSYYWQDDFVHLYLARELGLSREFLVRDHNDHLEIGANLLHWLLGRTATTSFLPAALGLLGLQLIASLLLLALLRELFGRSPWLLVPFAGYLFTPLALPVATWWSSGLEALPLQIGMLLALLGLVRALRRRSAGWAAVSVAGHALGLLAYEKALLVLPTLIAVLVLVEWAGVPAGRRLGLLARNWRYLLGHVLLVAAYVPLYLAVVDPSPGTESDGGSAGAWVGYTVFRLLLPGMFGGPWTSPESDDDTRLPPVEEPVAVALAVLAVAVVALSVWLRGRRALAGWLLVAGYVAVDLALVVVGRSRLLEMVTGDPRYLADALPVVAIGCCAAFSGPLVQRRVPRWLPRLAGSLAAALAVSAPLVAGAVVSTALVAEEMQHRQSRDYVAAVLQAMADRPGASVVSSQPPWDVNIFGYPGLREMMLALGRDVDFDLPGTEMHMFDGSGELRPITVIGRLQASGPVPGCGWPVNPGGQRLAELARGTGAAEVVRLGYLAGEGATLTLAVGDDEQELRVPPGAGQAFFVVTGQHGPVEIRADDAGASGVCVSDLVAGSPWPADGP
ncbi:hypothetical protein [Blastococcus sp. CCUG 61487]|uniref:hypothetical protein n=1 Tax=Blastococcus sp. CCUG 61487 TaxID=1840703 RepID=UPI0010BFDF58|nr:hypothetical protein [Blastococcus sp. CCUG 61487]TKJ20666.1 hypothetical protein A6V29_08470 [Blastococcus sp. CCUG 61487]